MKIKLFALIVLLVALGFFAFNSIQMRAADELTFSNTMAWDNELLQLANAPLFFASALYDQDLLAPPPANSSKQTKSELKALLDMKPLRNQQTIAAIKNQADAQSAIFGNQPLAAYFTDTTKPQTAEIFRQAFFDVNVLVMTMKKKFNRVRPHILEPKLEPAIPVPHHAAYPSGHATQAHFAALLLSEIFPHNRELYFIQARDIARNREIAGLHYASDSTAGEILAEHIFSAMKQNKNFAELLEHVRKEHLTNNN